MEFVDRTLKCSDCAADFVFTAGEQLFFADKQFKNDPKRCKPCKARRAGHTRQVAGTGITAIPLSRLETRTQCSACGIDTTVPFRPTQGRPVLCRSCFQMKRVPAAVAAVAHLNDPAAQVAAAVEALGLPAADGPAVASETGTMNLITHTPGALIEVLAESPSLELEQAAAAAPLA